MGCEQLTIFSQPNIDSLVLESSVQQDEYTAEISNKFDFAFDGKTKTIVSVPDFPKEFSIGLIVGSSGSGKSTLLRHCFGGGYSEEQIEWDNEKAIISNFPSAQVGIELLCAVGLASIPNWCRPYRVLSTGEKFRADMARKLHDNSVIDEFTSVVNRETAKSCSYSIQKYIRQKGLKNIVFASCHDDIASFLLPDWIYNTDTTQFYDGRYLQRDSIQLELYPSTTKMWDMFKKHHYLSGDINKASSCYCAYTNGYPVAFVASIAFPFGGESHAWREHRLVVLPDFQGIGIGNAVSEAIAQGYIERGCRYFSKTANPRCGIHRDHSKLWKPTSHNHKKREDYLKDGNVRVTGKHSLSEEMQRIHSQRVCYSHEYIGDGTKYEFTYGK